MQDNVALAKKLLRIVPQLLQRINADVPLEGVLPETSTAWQEVAELRATPGQLTLLRVLIEHERCMMQELAEHLTVAPSTVTAMVKRLLVRGYVERSRDDVDWRTVWVQATERGYRAVVVFEQARLASLQRRLEQLNDDELASIAAALSALLHLTEV